VVLRGTVATNRLQGITDILINKAGTKIYAAFSGRNPDRAIAGVWTSTTGNAATWTRIAGGMENQPDSVPGWRAYNADLTNFPAASGWGRIVLGFTANEDLLVLMNNSLNSDNGQS